MILHRQRVEGWVLSHLTLFDTEISEVTSSLYSQNTRTGIIFSSSVSNTSYLQYDKEDSDGDCDGGDKKVEK